MWVIDNCQEHWEKGYENWLDASQVSQHIYESVWFSHYKKPVQIQLNVYVHHSYIVFLVRPLWHFLQFKEPFIYDSAYVFQINSFVLQRGEFSRQLVRKGYRCLSVHSDPFEHTFFDEGISPKQVAVETNLIW